MIFSSVIGGISQFSLNGAMVAQQLDEKQTVQVARILFSREIVLISLLYSMNYTIPVVGFIGISAGVCKLFILKLKDFLEVPSQNDTPSLKGRLVKTILVPVNKIESVLDAGLNQADTFCNAACLITYVVLIILGHPLAGAIGLTSIALIELKKRGLLFSHLDRLLLSIGSLCNLSMVLLTPINIFLKGYALIDEINAATQNNAVLEALSPITGNLSPGSHIIAEEKKLKLESFQTKEMARFLEEQMKLFIEEHFEIFSEKTSHEFKQLHLKGFSEDSISDFITKLIKSLSEEQITFFLQNHQKSFIKKLIKGSSKEQISSFIEKHISDSSKEQKKMWLENYLSQFSTKTMSPFISKHTQSWAETEKKISPIRSLSTQQMKSLSPQAIDSFEKRQMSGFIKNQIGNFAEEEIIPLLQAGIKDWPEEQRRIFLEEQIESFSPADIESFIKSHPASHEKNHINSFLEEQLTLFIKEKIKDFRETKLRALTASGLEDHFTLNKTSIHAFSLKTLLSPEMEAKATRISAEEAYNTLNAIRESHEIPEEDNHGWNQLKDALLSQTVSDKTPPNFPFFLKLVKAMCLSINEEPDEVKQKQNLESLIQICNNCIEGWTREVEILVSPDSSNIKSYVHRRLAEYRDGLMEDELRSIERSNPGFFKGMGEINNVHLHDELSSWLWHDWRSFRGETHISIWGRGLVTAYAQSIKEEYVGKPLKELFLFHCNVKNMVAKIGYLTLRNLPEKTKAHYTKENIHTFIRDQIAHGLIPWNLIENWLSSLGSSTESEEALLSDILYDSTNPEIKWKSKYNPKWVTEVEAFEKIDNTPERKKKRFLTDEGVTLLLWDLGIIEPTVL